MQPVSGISGLSWFGVEQICREPSACLHSHAQPEPKRVVAAKHKQVDRLVGKLPDVEIAERLKVSAAVVYRRRMAASEALGELVESPRVARRLWTIQDARAAAAEHGGACLSRKPGSILRWRCAEGHLFEATAHRVIRRRQWCGRCSGQVKD